MTFLQRVLDAPSYGWTRKDDPTALYVPSHRELWREFFSNFNVLKSRKKWLPLFSWTATLALVPFFFAFFLFHFSLPLLLIGAVYSMVVLGSHGTFWLHRYGTHRAFRFAHPIIRTLCRNLTIRIIPEEIYIVSHHVHHQYSEQPGDPYNVHGGWLYCFLGDVNHQTIAKDLSERDYAQACTLMAHTGVRLNSYAEYQKWGSLCHPAFAIGHYLLNWGFWFGAFYWMGGLPLATAIFGLSGVWAFGVRIFNFDGHGRGKDRRQDGIDFNREDWSVNQTWPGYVAGEWHNNHHLYPNGARSGFLPYQLDLPWLAIKGLSLVGAVSSYRDYKADFFRDHYQPYLLKQTTVETEADAPTARATT